MTRQQVHDYLQAAGNVETLHAQAVAEAQREDVAAYDQQQHELKTQEQQADLSLAQRFGHNATREVHVGREHESQPDKDRDYELE
jgi:hypothetical protein